MKILIAITILQLIGPSRQSPEEEEREKKALSVFNVVKFPNSACGADNGFNGTCYTSSECSSKGGQASGTCASSFGVCCVFSIGCGGSSSANNSYAIISSYSTSTDSDPCTYTFCKTSSDVCKLRIDFVTMVLSAPSGLTAPLESAALTVDSITVGDCTVDSLTVSNPGGPIPPTICGYNTGQHMYVPASPQCNQINIDIDTDSTTTTRNWQIKVTQYECGNMMAPEQDCLQYHTATSGETQNTECQLRPRKSFHQVQSQASTGTRAPAQHPRPSTTCPASTTTSASGEPGPPAPSATPRRSSPPPPCRVTDLEPGAWQPFRPTPSTPTARGQRHLMPSQLVAVVNISMFVCKHYPIIHYH